MLAFGLEETGSYEQAEDAGLAALERNPDDVWAIHAVVHTYEMRGRVDDGIRFLRSREADWGSGNLFTVHNWWHLALFLLEAGRAGRGPGHLRRADPQRRLGRRPPRDARRQRPAVAAPTSTAHGHRRPLRPRWPTPGPAARWTTPWYAFNDLHAVMALVGAGRLDEARAVVDRLAAFVHATRRRASVAGRPLDDHRGRPARLPGAWSPSARTATTTSSTCCCRSAATFQPLRRLPRAARRPPAHAARIGPPRRVSSTWPGRCSPSGSACAPPASTAPSAGDGPSGRGRRCRRGRRRAGRRRGSRRSSRPRSGSAAQVRSQRRRSGRGVQQTRPAAGTVRSMR